jgi:hypothetical protein
MLYHYELSYADLYKITWSFGSCRENPWYALMLAVLIAALPRPYAAKRA